MVTHGAVMVREGLRQQWTHSSFLQRHSSTWGLRVMWLTNCWKPDVNSWVQPTSAQFSFFGIIVKRRKSERKSSVSRWTHAAFHLSSCLQIYSSFHLNLNKNKHKSNNDLICSVHSWVCVCVSNISLHRPTLRHVQLGDKRSFHCTLMTRWQIAQDAPAFWLLLGKNQRRGREHWGRSCYLQCGVTAI